MKCTKCLGNTKVADSRLPDEKKSIGISSDLLDECRRVWSWWSDDYRARKRKCEKCGHEFYTLEIELSDIEDALIEAANCAGGHAPWESIEIDNAILEERQANG